MEWLCDYWVLSSSLLVDVDRFRGTRPFIKFTRRKYYIIHCSSHFTALRVFCKDMFNCLNSHLNNIHSGRTRLCVLRRVSTVSIKTGRLSLGKQSPVTYPRQKHNPIALSWVLQLWDQFGLFPRKQFLHEDKRRLRRSRGTVSFVNTTLVEDLMRWQILIS